MIDYETHPVGTPVRITRSTRVEKEFRGAAGEIVGTLGPDYLICFEEGGDFVMFDANEVVFHA